LSVLAFNYDKFAVFHICQQITSDQVFETVEVLSRTPSGIDKQSLNKVRIALRKYTNVELDELESCEPCVQ
jgi:hypothetical protein